MRILKSELPEPILSEIRRVTNWGRQTAALGIDDRGRENGRLATRRYYEARRGMILAAVLYPVLIVGAALFASEIVGVSALWGVAIAALAGGPIFASVPSRWAFTAEELRAYLPLMRLAPVHAAYLEATIEANEPGAPRALRDEILPAIRRLVDESERLDLLEARLLADGRETIPAEIDAMRARLATVEDEGAREALGHAIVTAERRRSLALSARGARERIEAHRTMIGQSALAALEIVRRFRPLPSHPTFGSAPGSAPGSGLVSEPDLALLRENADGLWREVTALEEAVQEMRAL